MSVWESARVALDMLRLHKLRAFLTMLGVIIGVMSVTIIVMASTGFQYFLTYQIKKLGSDTLIIFYDPSRVREGDTMGGIEGLTTEDVLMIEERVSSIDIASGILQGPSSKVAFEDKNLKDPRVICTDEKQLLLSRIGIEKGRAFSRGDMDARANVCLIGVDVVERLFGKGEPIGQYLTFQGVTLQVVGVMEKFDILGQSNGKDVWIPITTAHDKWMGGEQLSYITARPKEGYEVNQAMDDVWRLLMQKSGNKPIYRVDSRESIINVFSAIIGFAQVVLAAIAALSLLVGGIGIMNIMLVSVTERTREIGLRKAVGARYTTILAQFLVESAVLSLVGGLIGMGIAFGVGQLVQIGTAIAQKPTPEGLPLPFPWMFGLIAAGFSALIGVVFGMYPAARAAALSPIEALRTE
ncbi:MAG: ABC transporter permease [Fimbriimonadaceae bacterium]